MTTGARSTSTTPPSWSPGTARRHLLHRRPPDRRDPRPQRARPGRYLVTDDGLVVLASEMGVLPIPEETIVEKWRLQPGKMLLIDPEQGRIVSDDEIKQQLTTATPTRSG